MKKSVVIIIGIIYLASIFVVGFFGTKIKAFNEMVYITNIECINEGLVDYGTYKEIAFDYNPDGTILENSLFIDYKVYPSNSTKRGKDAVEIIADPNDKLFTQDGVTFTFHAAPGLVTVYLHSLDGSNVVEKIDIFVY